MKACFVRKACTLNELKQNTGEGSEYVIERTIELEPAAYREFSNDLLEDREFLENDFLFLSKSLEDMTKMQTLINLNIDGKNSEKHEELPSCGISESAYQVIK